MSLIAIVIAGTMAAAAAQTAQPTPPIAAESAPSQPIRRAAPHSSMSIPDDVVPAVVPYMGCLIARDGIEVRGGFDPRPRGVGPGADCTPYREEARRRADTLLRRNGGRSAEERRFYIEQVLNSVDSFHESTRPAMAPRTQ